MSGRVQEWREGLYGLMGAVEAAYDAAYAAMGTEAEEAAYGAYKAAKAAFREAERKYVGTSYADDCGRCGGAGGSDAWRFTGWTCYECGGSGTTYRTWTKVRFRKDVRKQYAEDQAREAERRERDRVFAEQVAEMGAVGVALVTAAAECWRVDMANEYGVGGESVDRETRFRSDLAWKLHKFGSLTEAQVAAVERGLARDADEAAKAERAKAAGALGGTMDVEGTVLAVKWQESRYGGALKMMVELDDGRRVWGTVASALRDLGRGDRVAFTAAVEASADDETFGFFKRPRNARVLARAEREEGDDES